MTDDTCEAANNRLKLPNSPQEPADPEKYYAKPADLRAMIKQYYETEICDPGLAKALVEIARGLSTHRNFRDYSWKDEMINDAILNMYKALQKKQFQIESTFNPFSYFNRIAFTSFVNRIKKENRHVDTIKALQEKKYVELLNDPELGHLVGIYVTPPKSTEDE